VVAGLGDVVDDEDADLVGHLAWLVLGSRGCDGWGVEGAATGAGLSVCVRCARRAGALTSAGVRAG